MPNSAYGRRMCGSVFLSHKRTQELQQKHAPDRNKESYLNEAKIESQNHVKEQHEVTTKIIKCSKCLGLIASLMKLKNKRKDIILPVEEEAQQVPGKCYFYNTEVKKRY